MAGVFAEWFRVLKGVNENSPRQGPFDRTITGFCILDFCLFGQKMKIKLISTWQLIIIKSTVSFAWVTYPKGPFIPQVLSDS